MANLLPIPDDLQQLIEKREAAERRAAEDRRTAAGSAADVPPAPGDAAPTMPERRSDTERRQTTRREADG